MFKIKTFLIAFFLMVASVNYAQFTDVINSNRPGESMSAFSVGKTVFQAELGLFGISEKNDPSKKEANGFGSDLSVRYGAFLEQLEIMLDMQFQHDYYKAPLGDETRSGLKQTTLGVKYLIYDPFLSLDDKPDLYSWKKNHKFNWKDFIPAVGIYGGLNIKIGNNPFPFEGDSKVSPKVMLITQNHFGSRWVFVTNSILDKIATDNTSLGYVLTLTRGFNIRWSGFLEHQGVKSDFYSDAIFRAGAAFLIRENIQIDASIGKNIKDTPSLLVGGFGISWRFDQNYERALVRKTKEIKDDKKDKKGKDKKDKKDKGKKRKDEVELETPKP